MRSVFLARPSCLHTTGNSTHPWGIVGRSWIRADDPQRVLVIAIVYVQHGYKATFSGALLQMRKRLLD